MSNKDEKSALVGDVAKEEDSTHRLKVSAAVAFLVAIAVTKTQLTAALFSSSHYPTAFSLYSNVVTCFILVPIFLLKPSWWGVPTREMYGSMFLIILFTSLDMGLTNIALAELSTTLQTCIASTNPFWAIMLETALYSKFQHPVVYGVVSLVVVGAVLASVGTVDRINTLGVTAAVLGVMSSASKYVFLHSAFKKFQKQLGPYAMLFWVDLLMVGVFLVWLGIAYLAGNHELTTMFSETFTDLPLFWKMTGTAGLGGVRALSQYFVLFLVTATSMSTANIFVQTLNSLIAIPIQHLTVTATLIAGITLTIVFSATYAFLKSNKKVLPEIDKFLGCTRSSS